jgi:hypothetical protein
MNNREPHKLFGRMGVGLISIWLGLAPLSHAERIDVMVLYTPQVTTAQNGHDGARALVHSLVAGANQTYADSGIAITLNLVHTREVAYVEHASNMAVDLEALFDPDDGVLDEAHSLRSDWGADLVCLLRSDGGGIAYLLTNPSGDDRLVYSVVGQSGAGMVFTHELGHNMGAHHDRLTAAGDTALYSYSYGYRFNGTNAVQYRTIMAYDPGIWIPRFSNPLQHYQGTALGLPEGHAQSADNARTLNLSAPVVASYRDEVPAAPALIIPPENLRAIAGTRQALQAQVLGAPPLSMQWYLGTQGDTTTPLAANKGQGLEVTVAEGTRSYWMQAWNGDGSVQSSTVSIQGVAAWTGNTPAVDQSQTSGNTYYLHNLSLRYWQEWVPTMPYLDAVELRVNRVNSGSSFLFRLLDSNDLCLFEQTISVSTSGWVRIPVGRWIHPGRTYRLEVVPGNNTTNYVAWFLNDTENPYPAGGTSFSGSGSPDFDFVFRTFGGSNTPPVLSPIGSRSIQVGQTLHFTIHSDDADGDALQYSATGGSGTP